jgi:hypothetical protein
MQTFIKLTIEATLLAGFMLFLTAAPERAVAEQVPCGGPPPFAEFDTDGNGFLTEAEFEAGRAARHAAMAEAGRPMKGMASAPSFADFDTDNDGQLSADEFGAGHRMHMQKMHGDGHHWKGRHKGHGGKHADKAHMTFESIDTDADGCISKAEFDAHHAAEYKKQ